MSKTILITGATRGIGQELFKQIRANEPSSHIIVGVRDTEAPAAKSLSAQKNVSVVRIDSLDDSSASQAAKELTSKGVTSIDLLIANAGYAPTPQEASGVDASSWRDAFTINTIAPLLLFQAFKPFLQQSSAPTFVLTSTLVASVELQPRLDFKTTAYNSSKAALNMVGKRISVEEPWLTTILIHPGMVADTDMAKGVVGEEKGLELLKSGVAISSQQSAERILTIVNDAKLDTHSGRFFDAQAGGELPW